jgi:hypothetical protein
VPAILFSKRPKGIALDFSPQIFKLSRVSQLIKQNYGKGKQVKLANKTL